MAGVPPKKNTAYTFYIGLEDKANPGLFKASPTLSAGDWKIAIDDGAPANLATLPVADADFTKRVKVALSADEMNGDHITIIASDAAGAEWYDLQINIDTDAKQIGDLATQTSVDDVPTVAEFNARTLLAASYFDPATDTVTPAGGQINSVSGTVSANLVQMNGDTDPVDNLVLALGSGGLVEKLNSMLEAAGLAYRFTAEALAEGPSGSGLTGQETANAVNNLAPVGVPAAGSIGDHLNDILTYGGGSGTGTYTDTIKDPNNNPLDGARVQLSTDAAGTHRVYEAFTNALGVFVMNPDPGIYYRWIDLAGYTDRLTQGAQVTVT